MRLELRANIQASCWEFYEVDDSGETLAGMSSFYVGTQARDSLWTSFAFSRKFPTTDFVCGETLH